jgi:hypothetical protein
VSSWHRPSCLYWNPGPRNWALHCRLPSNHDKIWNSPPGAVCVLTPSPLI